MIGRGRLGLLVLALGLGPVHAQTPIPFGGSPFGQSTHAFRAVLKQVGGTPLTDPNTIFDDPAHSVLIVFGDTSPLTPWLQGGKLIPFLNAGGSVLIASDRATSDAFYQALQIRIQGTFVTARESLAYRRELLECPLVIELGNADKRHPIFQGLPEPSTIATNRPSLISRSFLYEPLAAVSAVGQQFQFNFQRYNDAALVIAARKFGDRGRLLVLADHSLFINDMMLQADNDNIPFAFNVARWLTDQGQRARIVFLDEGKLQTDFNVSLEYPMPPLPPLEAMVPLANQFMSDLEREDVFRKLFQQIASPWRVMRVVAALLTAGLVIVLIARFLTSRQRPDPRVARLRKQASAGTPPLPWLEQRQREAMASQNLAEAAHELAWQTLAALGVEWAPGAPPPRLATGAGWRQRRSWRNQIATLWALANPAHGRRIGPRDLEQLARSIAALQAAAHAGDFRLSPPEAV